MMFRSWRRGSIGACRKLCNEELYGLCSSPNIIKVIDKLKGDEMDGACGKQGGEKKNIV